MNNKFTLFCLPLVAAPAFGSQNFVDESLFVDDALPMVLTASRMTQSPLDAPAPVTIIDHEMIRASGFTEVQDLMRLVPGFLVADWPSGPPMVVNNGLGDANGRRLQVLLDGRALFTAPSTARWTGPTCRSGWTISSASRWCAPPTRRLTARTPFRAWSTSLPVRHIRNMGNP